MTPLFIFATGWIVGVASLACGLWLFDITKEYMHIKVYPSPIPADDTYGRASKALMEGKI